MTAPTAKAIGLLKSIGLSKYQLAADMRSPGGILAAISDLKTKLDKSDFDAHLHRVEQSLEQRRDMEIKIFDRLDALKDMVQGMRK